MYDEKSFSVDSYSIDSYLFEFVPAGTKRVFDRISYRKRMGGMRNRW